MEIINSNVALLSNYEVLRLLEESEQKTSKSRQRKLENFETVRFEVKQYFSRKSCRYQSKEQINNLLEALLNYPITKAEKLQILNLRPKKVVELHLLLEECEERFDGDQLEEIVNLIKQHLPVLKNEDDEDYEEEEEEEVGEEENEEEMEPIDDEEDVEEGTLNASLNLSKITFEGHSINLEMNVLSDF